MQVVNCVTTLCDIYEDYCGEENELITFQYLRLLLENQNFKLQDPRDLYPVFSVILKFGQAIDTPFKKRSFVNILNLCQGESIARVGFPPIQLDFKPIISFIQNAKPHEFKVSIVEVNDNMAVARAAYAIDQLTCEGIGFSFGERIYKKLLESQACFAVVVKNESDEIVGATLGTLLHVRVGKVAIKTFHFVMCARRANYPGIQLVEMLKPFEEMITKRHQPDCISLNVHLGNVKAVNLYSKAGFVENEKHVNDFGQEQSFMVKNKSNVSSLPKAEAVFKAFVDLEIETLGAFEGYTSMIGVYATKAFNSIRYT
jgi:hypothetical protein